MSESETYTIESPKYMIRSIGKENECAMRPQSMSASAFLMGHCSHYIRTNLKKHTHTNVACGHSFKNTLNMVESIYRILIKIEYTLIYLFDACKVSNDDISFHSFCALTNTKWFWFIFVYIRFEIECVRTNLLMC